MMLVVGLRVKPPAMYYKEEKLGVDEIAKTIGVSKMTL
jgi:DNA-binding XRE family transcriptional regulator